MAQITLERFAETMAADDVLAGARFETLSADDHAAALDRAGLVALLSGTTVKLDLSGRPVSAGEQVHVALDGLPAGLDGAVAEVRALEALGDLQGALALTQESRFLTQRAGALASGLLDSGAPGSLSEDQLLDLFDQIQASGSTDPELLSLATLIEAGNFEAAAEIAANESVQSRMKTILAA